MVLYRTNHDSQPQNTLDNTTAYHGKKMCWSMGHNVLQHSKLKQRHGEVDICKKESQFCRISKCRGVDEAGLAAGMDCSKTACKTKKSENSKAFRGPHTHLGWEGPNRDCWESS